MLKNRPLILPPSDLLPPKAKPTFLQELGFALLLMVAVTVMVAFVLFALVNDPYGPHMQ